MSSKTELFFLEMPNATVTLASVSKARRMVLRSSGLKFRTLETKIDEVSVRESAKKENMDFEDIAVTLAFLKARSASEVIINKSSSLIPSFVIGCDQILLFNNEIIDKPASLMEAKKQLMLLSGNKHELLSAIVLFRDGQRIWHHVARAFMSMRKFNDSFADSYIKHVGKNALQSPGAYQIESVGSSLFTNIEGNHFDILGLPLLPLLSILREHGLRPLPSESV